ncbi:MAG: TetR/AcrR family transcriptional regulator [Treponemataceae bacterium]
MDETRERILSTSRALFADRGYNAVGVQEICLLSGITKPTLYYHFGNKIGLLNAVASDLYLGFIAALKEEGSYKGDLAVSLTGSLRVFLRYAAERPDLMRLRLTLSFSPPSSEEYSVMSPYAERLYEFFKEVFRSASEDHGNMKGRESAYAASFIGTADAYAGLRLAGALEPDDQFIRRVVHYFMHGVFS